MASYQEMNKSKHIFTVVLLFFVSIISYVNILSGDFIWDDHCLIVNNSIIKQWHNLGRIFFSEIHQNTFTNYYRPIQIFSYKIDYIFFGLNPAGYHFVNIFLHAIAGILLFYFLTYLIRHYFLSLATTLFFLAHPINVSAVAYISGRADLLAAIFVFSSFLFYLKTFSFDSCHGSFLSRKNISYYAGSLCMFIFALLTKEVAIALPFILCGIDAFSLKSKGRFKRVIVFFAVLCVYFLTRLTFLNFSSGNPFVCKKGFAVFDIGFFARCAVFFKTLLIYIGSLFIPVNLHMERIVNSEHIYMFHYAGIFLCVLLCFLVFKKLAHGLKFLARLFIFAVFWFFVWLMPQSAFILPNIMADHFLYLPSIGIFLIIAMAINAWRIRKIALAVLCVYFCSFTWQYNQIWKNELSFFCWTAKQSPYSYKAHDCLADLYLKMNRLDNAVWEYEAILSKSFGISCEKDIDVLARKSVSSDLRDKKREIASSVFYNLGVVYFQQGRLQQARAAYMNALKLNPESEQVYNNLGLLYAKAGDLRKAEEMYKKAIVLKKDYVQPYNNLAVLYAQRGDYSKAATFWKEVLRIDPDYEAAKMNIALARELILGQGKKVEGEGLS